MALDKIFSLFIGKTKLGKIDWNFSDDLTDELALLMSLFDDLKGFKGL